MSHNKEFLKKDVLTNILWSMIPETKAFCPLGLGIIPYELPGSAVLANETVKQLDEYDVVLWEKHGVFAADTNVLAAFDQIDVLTKAAQIYIDGCAMGFKPEGMSQEQLTELSRVFKLPK
jgi:rhamnulose-1-phosphate aldolase